MVRKAVVLLSGGMDSATTLAMAKKDGFECYALSFRYGQRHSAELNAAKYLAKRLKAKMLRIVNMDLAGIGNSALTDTSMDIPEQPGEGIPVTYVPARNTVFLSVALAWAEVIDAQDILLASTPWIIPVIQIAAQNTSVPSKKWRILRPRQR